MWILVDPAGTILPEGLRFFSPGWWVVHALAVVLVFAWGYRKGRRDERAESGARRATAARSVSEEPPSPHVRRDRPG